MKRMLLPPLFFLALVCSCKKEKESNNDCLPHAATVRQLANRKATVKETAGQFYIIEEGSIDSRLKPCNLPEAFRVDNLAVTVSGDVKAADRTGLQPCCTDPFVITGIAR